MNDVLKRSTTIPAVPGWYEVDWLPESELLPARVMRTPIIAWELHYSGSNPKRPGYVVCRTVPILLGKEPRDVRWETSKFDRLVAKTARHRCVLMGPDGEYYDPWDGVRLGADHFAVRLIRDAGRIRRNRESAKDLGDLLG